MNAIQQLLDHINIWTTADTSKKSGRGRSSNNATCIYGMKKLRGLILELAIRGKLVPQNPNDDPAIDLLKRIQVEKETLISKGKIKKCKPLLPAPKNEEPFILPYGWSWASLYTLTLQITDGTHHTPKYQNNGIPFISVKDIDGKTVSFMDCKYIDEKEHQEINLRCNPERGDILLCRIGTLGRPTIVDTEKPFSLFVSVGLLKLPKSVEISHYLQLALSSPLMYTQYDKIKAGGSHTNKLNLIDIPRLLVPIPPINEQDHILKKVDILMALCDQIEAQHNHSTETHGKLVKHFLDMLAQSKNTEEFNKNWKYISEHFNTLFITENSIDALKKTLLQLAIMGKLVPQDPNDEPADELLKRINAEKVKLIAKGKIKQTKTNSQIVKNGNLFDLPHGWEWCTFPELGELARGKSKHRPRNDPKLYKDGTIPLIQTGDVARAHGTITTYTTLYNKIGLEQSRLWPAGTMCITIAANIADSAILGFDACFPDSVVGFIPFLKEINVRFYELFLRTAKNDLQNFAPSTAQKNINLEILNNILIPVPPANEMHRIVFKVDKIMLICEQMKIKINEANKLQKELADLAVKLCFE